MNEILISYIEDLRDSILLFNESLISVQNGAVDEDTINNIFRVAHTIKGNSAAMNFMKIQKVMHTMEDLLTDVRNGERELTDDMITILFACHDFLEDCLAVVQSQSSDEGMDTTALLQQLTDLKDGVDGGDNTPEAPAASESLPDAAVEPVVSAKGDGSPIEDMDLGIGMPIDIWKLLEQNTLNGMSAYKTDIYFMKNSSMKAVRSWMIFDRIDQTAILVYSNPPRLTENDVDKIDSNPFEANVINAIILSDQEVSELVDDLSETPDVEKVEIKRIDSDIIAERVVFAQKQGIGIGELNEICVEVLGVDSQFIPEEIITDIISKMERLLQLNIAHSGTPVVICAERIIMALQEAVGHNKKISAEQSENLIFLCQTIEECISSPGLIKNSNFISVMYKRLDDFIESVTSSDKRIGDILASQGLIQSKDEEAIVQRSKDEGLKFGQAAVKEGLVTAYEVLSALNNEKSGTANKPRDTSQTNGAADKKMSAIALAISKENEVIKVPVTKVDSLIDNLSELLIYNSQLEQSFSQLEIEDSKLGAILSRTEKLIKEIQDISMSLRMVEIKPTFHKLSRVVRDTATSLKKKVSITLEGEDTEIDRSAVDKLYDPLMHIVRNAVAHGIEDSENARTAVGKKPDGQITIAGYKKRSDIYIEVRDDGRGINTEKVLAKAKEKGLINENREYTDEEIFKFILLPGFSTQENVDAISGRGVGMNVVEDSITKLGGKIEIESKLGAGSIFRLKLPVNLAVVNGTIVEMSGVRYIIPTVCVRKFFTVTSKDLVSLQGENRAIKLDDGSIISLISKERIFGLPDVMIHSPNAGNNGNNDNNDNTEHEMVLLEVDQKLLILHVDKIINRQDVVSKPLATDFATVPYANSASILGDGIVSLILDIDAIFKMSQAT